VARRVGAEAPSRRGGEGPRERRLAALRAGGASTLARRCLGAWAHAASGHPSLDPRAAGERRARVEPPHTPPRAEAGDGVESVHGLGVGRRGRRHDGPGAIAAARVLAVPQGARACHTLGPGGSGQPLGDPVAVRCVGALLPQRGPVRRPVGLREGRQERRAGARQRHAAPGPSPGRPPRRGRDRGLGQPPAAPPHGEVLGIERVVWGFAPMDGRQSEGRPEHPGQTGARAESGQPLPGEEACDPDDQVLPGGGEGCEKGGWAGGPLPVPQDVPIPGHETEGHGTRVHVDAPRTWVLWGGESPEVSSSCA
jgi:hypothetical protein